MSAGGVGLRRPMSLPFRSVAPAPKPAGAKRRRSMKKKPGPSPLAEVLRKGQDLLFGARSQEAAPSESMADDEGMMADEDALMPAAPPPVQRTAGILARVVRFADGVLIVEFTVEVDTPWQAQTVVAHGSDGRSTSLSMTAPTTRAGQVSAGATIRLALSLAEGSALPSTLVVTGPNGTLTLHLDAR
ncbi:MAG: hypothetical protein AB8H79_14525, partial [Myxococcota bacterium]